MSTIEGFIALVIGFGFIIFVHELGHFLVAKAIGIKVTQFAVGMGHAILTWRKGLGLRVGSSETEVNQRIREHITRHHGDEHDPPSEQLVREAHEALRISETEYRLNWMPIGGYVKMLGQEDLDPSALSDDPRSFNAQPVWARACVISAGVIVNLIFAMIFFVIAFTYGVEFPRNIVGGVQRNGPASTAFAVGHPGELQYYGLQVGDRIVDVNGEKITDFMEVTLATALAEEGSKLNVTVERPGEPKPLRFIITPEVSPRSDLLSIGVDVPVRLLIEKTLDSTDVYRAGVRPDMRITAVDGEPPSAYHEYHRAITAADGLPVEVSFKHEVTGETTIIALRANPQLTQLPDGAEHLIGFVPATRVPALAKGDPPAKEAGVLPGDILLQVGDVAWPTPRQVSEQVHAANNKMPVLMIVQRDGERKVLPPIDPTRKGKIGIYQDLVLDESIVGQTIAGSPAAMLNLNPGSRITSINGAAVQDWADMQRKLQMDTALADTHAEIRIGYELNIVDKPSGEKTVTLDAEHIQDLAVANWDQPIPMRFFQVDKELIQAGSTAEAVELGFIKTHQMMVKTYLTLARLFQGTVKVSHLKGPIGIVHIGTQVAMQGWTYLLFFLGLISVNLVVINFLPMPIVDGGLMVFLIIEKIKGSPVSPKVMSAANLVGLVMIAALFLTVTYFDINSLLP